MKTSFHSFLTRSAQCLACLMLASLLFSTPLLAQAPAKQWDKRYGGYHYDRPNAMLATSDGGYLLAGLTNSNINGDVSQPTLGTSVDGQFDGWVIKLSSNGTKQWDRRLGGNDFESISTIVATADGGYLLGGYTLSGANGNITEASRGEGDCWVIKINSQGTKLWDRRYGGANGDYLSSMVTTPDGGFLLGGTSESGISGDKTQASRGYFDYWVIRINSQGTKLWDQRYGGASNDYLTVLVTTSDGGYLLGGTSESGISGDKSQVSLDPKPGTDDSGDYWVVKINSQGTKLWDQRFGGDKKDDLAKLIVTSDGDFLLGGTSESGISGDKSQASRGLSDYWVVKISSQGTKLWDQRYGGADRDELSSLVATSDGGYLLGSSSRSEVSGDKTQASRGFVDYWLIRINSQGTKLWDQRYGGDNREDLMELVTTSEGGYLLGGNSSSSIGGDKTVENWKYTDSPTEDFWLVKTYPEGSSDYPMGTTNVTACGGTFYDEGYNGDYANNTTLVHTFSPNKFSPLYKNYRVQANFELFETEAGYDKLYIYNGATTSAPLIGTYSGSTSPGVVTASNPTGQLTFQFISDGSVVKQGWRASLKCLYELNVILPNFREASNLEVDLPAFSLKASPNPFKEQTTLSFQLNQTQAARLLIYDSQGRQVGSLYEGEAQAGQTYRVDFSGQGRLTGLYIARLLTASGTAQQKLVLVR